MRSVRICRLVAFGVSVLAAYRGLPCSAAEEAPYTMPSFLAQLPKFSGNREVVAWFLGPRFQDTTAQRRAVASAVSDLLRAGRKKATNACILVEIVELSPVEEGKHYGSCVVFPRGAEPTGRDAARLRRTTAFASVSQGTWTLALEVIERICAQRFISDSTFLHPELVLVSFFDGSRWLQAAAVSPWGALTAGAGTEPAEDYAAAMRFNLLALVFDKELSGIDALDRFCGWTQMGYQDRWRVRSLLRGPKRGRF